MSYVKKVWRNGSTPLSAANLNNIETGIETVDLQAAQISANLTTLTATTIPALESAINGKQDQLDSGVTIKTINNESLLGSGNINTLTTTDLANYYTKTEADTKFEEKTNSTFKINGTIYQDANITLPVGAVYELTGTLNGSIILNDDTGNGANTQIILNNVTINSSTANAIYCNQTKKKLVVTALAGTTNKLVNGAGATADTAAVEAENSLVLITNKNSTIDIKSVNGSHTVKAQSLYLQGEGLVRVDSGHDGFHGSHVIRVDSGNYEVLNAGSDAFEAKNSSGDAGELQVIGGNITIYNCAADGFSSKLPGVVAGYTANIKFKTIGDQKFNNVKVLETVPAIAGYTETRTSLSEYYGPAVVKVDSATGDDVALVEGKYKATSKTIYVKGYIDHPIELTIQSTDLIFDGACVSCADAIACINYAVSGKKLAFKSDDEVESINYIINTGVGLCVKSQKNLAIQKDASYILKSTATNIRALETTIRGDGARQFISDATNIDCADLYIGADTKDIGGGGEFAANSIYCNSDIVCQAQGSNLGSIKYVYAQVGAVTCNDIRAEKFDSFYVGASTAHIQTKKSKCLTMLKDVITDDLRTRVRTLEAALTALTARVEALEPVTD